MSGWDAARNCPKPGIRVVPAGSVYWFEVLQPDPDAFRTLLDEGLWPLWTERDEAAAARRAEGFNNVHFGDWDISDWSS